MKTLFKVLISLATSLYLAFILTVMWGWFLIPMGLPELTLHAAAGITVLRNLFFTDYFGFEAATPKTKNDLVYVMPIFYTLTWGVGWGFHMVLS